MPINTKQAIRLLKLLRKSSKPWNYFSDASIAEFQKANLNFYHNIYCFMNTANKIFKDMDNAN